MCYSELNSVACNPMNNNNTIYQSKDQSIIIKMEPLDRANKGCFHHCRKFCGKTLSKDWASFN